MTGSNPWADAADPAEPEGVAAELERLKRVNADLTEQLRAATGRRRGPRFASSARMTGTALLAALAVLPVCVAVPAVWMRAQVLDTDSYAPDRRRPAAPGWIHRAGSISTWVR